MGRPAIFLDRDGVINENLPDHVRSWETFRFLPGALAAIRALTELRAPLFVVTNQAVIERRLVSRACLDDIHARMLAHIRRAGGEIAEVLYCPHGPETRCRCRKPAPGMLLSAAARFDLDLARSVLIGDALSDMQAGQRAGCRTVLVQTGRGPDALRDLIAGATARPTALARDLPGAVPIVAELLRGAPDKWQDTPVPIGVSLMPVGAPTTAASGVAD